MKLTITLDDNEVKILKKRAGKNLFSLKEQIEDIVRRSCATYKGGRKYRTVKVDDRLVEVFSREKRGRKKKKKVVKKK